MVSVSIVSHGHGGMVWSLVSQLLRCPEVGQVLVTCNIPEDCPTPLPDCVELLTNAQPRGFGANHNAAFARSRGDHFCVLNPDVELLGNPFPLLLTELRLDGVALAAPMARNQHGGTEDNFRPFPTWWSLARRALGRDRRGYAYAEGGASFATDWAAGMFMLLPRRWYAQVRGFDERYFLYYEDVDLCARLRRQGGDIRACPGAVIVHDGQRASHRGGAHLRWHLGSMARYLWRWGWPGCLRRAGTPSGLIA